MEALRLFMFGVLLYLLVIVSLLFLSLIIGFLKLMYDFFKYCITNDNFVLGFLNIKKLETEINPV